MTVVVVRSPGHETCHHVAYRLTCEEFEELLARADGHCELCGTESRNNHGGKLFIDHDSFRGWAAVRGLVCSKCNAHLRRVDAGERPHDIRTVRYFMRAYRVGPLRQDFAAWIAGDLVTHNVAFRDRTIMTGQFAPIGTVRPERAAPAEGCRWCRHPRRDHGRRWVASRRWHAWERPTQAQITARGRAYTGTSSRKWAA